MDDMLTPAVEASLNRLDASMEASIDRIDALLAQILNQECINALDHKFSWDLKPHLLSPTVLASCDSLFPSTDDADFPDGPKFQTFPMAIIESKNVVSMFQSTDPPQFHAFSFLVSEQVEDSLVRAVGLARTPQSAIGVSCFSAVHKTQFREGFEPITAQTLVSSYQSSSKIVEIKIPAQYWVQESGASLALPLFVAMPTSAGLCNGCPGVLDFELDYLMGFPDKRGGFIWCIWRQELRRVRNKLTLISSFSCMNASASAQEWKLLCFHGGYANDFEFDYHMGIRDKGGGLLGWIWWQEVRRFSHNPFRQIGVGLSVCHSCVW